MLHESPPAKTEHSIYNRVLPPSERTEILFCSSALLWVSERQNDVILPPNCNIMSHFVHERGHAKVMLPVSHLFTICGVVVLKKDNEIFSLTTGDYLFTCHFKSILPSFLESSYNCRRSPLDLPHVALCHCQQPSCPAWVSTLSIPPHSEHQRNARDKRKQLKWTLPSEC
jgi:hypothetical protein